MLSPGDRLGDYEVRSLIGKGGMGEVYLGRDTKLQRDVALKVLSPAFVHDPERLARFRREAQVLASLNHPRIATLYGLEDSGTTHALVMEYVEGPTLENRIERGPIPWEEARPIALQLAEALEYAHDKNVVHRDIKPANIKVSADGVKVLDFGLAKALADDPPPGSDPRNSPTLTLTMATTAGTILGTAAYMSPEQAKGRPVDRRSDVWAFGVVLYEMLTAKRLFAGDDSVEILAGVIKDTPSLDALPSATPRAVRRLIERCLEKEPKRRLQHIGEARIAMEDASRVEATAAASAVAPTAASTITAAPAPRRRRTWPWIVVGAAGLIGGLVMDRSEVTPPVKEVLKYTLPAPDKTRLENFALSPDGRTLAIQARAEKVSQLWVRALDSLEARALGGTEGAIYPFWSPDSRTIAFFAGGKLKKIAATGGPVQTLCDAPAGRGGTWNADGVIVFAPAGAGKGLQRVSAAGGVPVDLTKIESPDVAYRFPQFLPDGRRFLYLVSNAKENGVYLGLVDAKPEAQPKQRILADESSTRYVAPGPEGSGGGHLLFVRDTTLMAQPVDSKTLAPSGDVFPIAERIARGINTNYQLFSVAPGMLVYSTGIQLIEHQLAWVDRSGKQIQSLAGRALAKIALSPDGKRLVAARPAAGSSRQQSDLWMLELDRNTESRFTFDPSQQGDPVWSPDGSRVVFASSRGRGQNMFDVYQRPSNGSGHDELVAQFPGRVRPSDWSRDGRFLILSSAAQTGGGNDVMALSMQSGEQGAAKPVPLVATRFNDAQGRLSPDGRWLAYMSLESGTAEVYVQPFDPSGAAQPAAASGKWQISVGGGQQPLWSNDGKELFYLSPDRKLMVVDVSASSASFSRTTPRELFATHFEPAIASGPEYAVSLDGKRFLMPSDPVATEEPPLTVVVNWLESVKK